MLANAPVPVPLKPLSRVRRCLQLPANTRGRDFVVGDLHGHRALLERELAQRGFNAATDRVFSVGDLIDRGPDSLATLELLSAPWFHAALGNHELMLLNYLGAYKSRLYSRKAFAEGGGQWIKAALARQPSALLAAARRVAQLPLALHVADAFPFNVTHADLHLAGLRQAWLFADATLCIHRAEQAVSSRTNLAEALQRPGMRLPFLQHSVQFSPQAQGPLPLTYVGHTRARHITVHNSHVHIDQGVGAPQAHGRSPLTVLEHRPFALWLRGVGLVRPTLAPAATLSLAA
ncbi:Calcineurin-like phosphoesterase [Burkholderiales bacterium JOSHI_001]|nr:Calcineurin-like phosphoesterase [Burkholderiales bacterium JOSHI_001]